MQYCTACQKSIATIHILDLQNGSIVEQKHLCSKCAEQSGMVQQKAHTLKMGSAEMLDLIGSVKMQETEPGKERGTCCPSCGLSAAEFKVRGRMGCPRCYEVFRGSVVQVLERVHDATCHRGRAPGQGANPPENSNLLAELRQRLATAIADENYEEAAALRDKIRAAEEAEEAES